MEIKKGFTPHTKNLVWGFTLTELLIVVGIIGFLGTLIMAYFRSQVFKANDAKRKADLVRISQALEEYEKDADCYPAAIINLKPYLDTVPQDSVYKTAYRYEYDTATACAKWYRLYSKLDNTKDLDYQVGIGPGGQYNYVYTSPNAP